MRLLPQSLFGRLLVGLLSIVAVTILIVVLLILRDRREFTIWGDGRADVIATIAELTRRIAATAPSERDETVRAMAQEALQSRTDERPSPMPRPDLNSVMRVYSTRLADVLGDEFHIRVDRAGQAGPKTIVLNRGMPGPGQFPLPADGFLEPRTLPDRLPSPGIGAFPGDGTRMPPVPRGLDVVVTLPDGDEYAFRTDLPLRPPPGMNATFLQLGLLTVFLAGGLLFVTRTITRPLLELAQASELIGRGRRPSPLVERGARELRETTRAFNAMQERLQRYLDSRAGTLAAMSHDLRTPLTRLRLRLEKIANSEVRDKCTQDLEEMNRLIDGSLSFFRALNDDSGDAELESLDVDELCNDLGMEFAEMGHAVRVHSNCDCRVAARPQAIKRCLSNLIANAVRFGSQVTLSAECNEDIVIRVRDDGPGIPADELERVFQPFYRVDSSRNQHTGGVGLGLAIARDIAQLHGGTLTLRNCSPGLEAVLILPRSIP